jgi:hypothetical protein
VLELSYAADALQVALKGALAGSAEEQCVRHALSDLAAPPGSGRSVQRVK